MPIKNNMPVTTFMKTPAIPQGMNRCSGATGSCFKNPSMRRLSNPIAPRIRIKPMK